jgi:hypothetical protein
MTVLHVAVGNGHIAGRAQGLFRHADFAGFKRNAVVADGEMDAGYGDAGAAFGIEAVGIGAVGGGGDRQVDGADIDAMQRMQSP